ncbi:unnamed protein product [Polarella glacialis]|uniref:Glucose-methanol-choline oxidoreductase N-terminal domain-containing protein n=1 Tax=Polarella glacialis TaxID=89957 RepID=A0A813FB02_POLGL|nr:unnamed protein product [Polarella glacialis]
MFSTRCIIRGVAGSLSCLLLASPSAAHTSTASEEYDFVIVGGGLAGSVLANRLSASGKHSVLLLNVAGAPPNAYSGPVVITDEFIISKNITASNGLSARIRQPGYGPVPAFSTDLTGSSPARMLGGSTLVGLSLYLRDHPEALDAWGEGWSWEELRPYFHRAEGLQGTKRALKESDYGQAGPYTVQELPAFTHSLTQDFIRSSTEQGLPWAPDLNTERGSGVGLNPTTQHADGSKVNAFDVYLAPALERHNLVVKTGARADRLLIKDDICHGVAYRRLADSTDHVVHAKKEVIVSSGYVYSPRLLFLSGIGAKEDLEAVGLKVVKDLPAVGRNLTAARFSPLAWRTKEPTLSQMMGAPISATGAKANPAAYGSTVLEATARSRSSVAAKKDPTSSKPDIVLTFMPLFYAPKSAPLQYSLQGEPWPLKTNAFTIQVTLGETKAQGSVTFTGSPDVSPVVTHDAMTHPEDLARAREAVELAKRIGGSSALGRATTAIENGAGAQDMWTAVYDGRGTCRMGKHHHDSVVDHHLRVHGITNLRVVDGSVIPVGSPYLAVPEVLAVAERASELILNRHIQTSQDSGVDLDVDAPAPSTVTIEHLTKKLGESFPLLQAIKYLNGEQVVDLSEVEPVNASLSSYTSACALFAAISCVAGSGALAAIFHRKSTNSRDDSYAALIQA